MYDTGITMEFQQEMAMPCRFADEDESAKDEG
jgi:hypothetical protein